MKQHEARELFERLKTAPPIAGPWETVLALCTYRETPLSNPIYVAKAVRKDAAGREVASVTQRGDSYFWDYVREVGKPMSKHVAFGEPTRIESSYIVAMETADAHLRAVGYYPIGGFAWVVAESEPVGEE